MQSTPLGSLHASGDTGLSPGQHQQRATTHDDERNRGALLNKVVDVLCFYSLYGSGNSLANWDSCPTPAKSEGIEYLHSWPHRS